MFDSIDPRQMISVGTNRPSMDQASLSTVGYHLDVGDLVTFLLVSHQLAVSSCCIGLLAGLSALN